MQKWEIAGISAAPILEALLALDLHTKMGLSEGQVIHVMVALFTMVAIARALMDKRKVAASAQ